MSDNAEAVKPGWKTSEFWLHLFAYVPGILGMVIGKDHPLVLALGVVASVVGHNAAGDYSEQRKDLKQFPGRREIPLPLPSPMPPLPPAVDAVKEQLLGAAGQLKAALEDPEISAVIGQVLASMKLVAKKNGVELEPEPAAEDPAAVAAADPPAAPPAPAAAPQLTPAGKAVVAAAGAIKTYGPGHPGSVA